MDALPPGEIRPPRPAQVPSPVKPHPCPAPPHPVEMLETTDHLWGKTETEPREKIHGFEESPYARNLL